MPPNGRAESDDFDLIPMAPLKSWWLGIRRSSIFGLIRKIVEALIADNQHQMLRPIMKEGNGIATQSDLEILLT